MESNKAHRRRWLRATALTSALLLVAAACGDDSDDSDDGDEDAPAAAGDFGGQIIGIDPGAGLMEATRDRVMPEYGLEDDYTLVESSTAAMLTELDTAISNEEWIVVTLWQPHWAYDAYDIKNLEDPEGTLGDGEDLLALGRDGFSEDFPEVAEWLDNFALDADELNGLANLVVQDYGEGQEQEAIEDWLSDDDNRELAEGWINEDDAEGGSIEIGWIPWDEAIAVTYLWQNLLTEQGYDVTLTQLDVAPLYAGLANGDIDVFLDAWLPDTHASYWDEYGDDIEELGVWNEEATLHLAVPSYVDIDSIDELADHAG